MSKQRMVDTSFWSDVWVQDDLDKLQRYFFLYLITNERTTVAGVYQAPIKLIASETDFTRDEIKSMFLSMSERVQYFDGWVALRNAIKNQNYNNGNIKAGIKAVLEKCPTQVLDYINMPKDFDVKITRQEQTKLRVMEESSKSPGESSHLTKLNTDLTKPNLTAGKPPRAASAKAETPKRLSGKQAADYAKAVRADEAQEARVRKREKTESHKRAKSAAEIFQETQKREEQKSGATKISGRK